MKELIDKRAEYIKKIQDINTKIEIDIQNYKNDLNNKISQMVADYRTTITNENKEVIDIYRRRIDVLDEMIKEEVPQVDTITTLIKESISEDNNLVYYNNTDDKQLEDKTDDVQVVRVDDTADVVVKNDELDISDNIVNTTTTAETLERPGMATITIPSRI